MAYEKLKERFEYISFCSIFKKLTKPRFFLLQFFSLILLLSACTDQGCIEADDFGEYETQTLEVFASANSEKCVYDSSKPLADASQGDGLKSCLAGANQNVVITDETGAEERSSNGCIGLSTVKFQNLCASQCISDCLTNSGADFTASAEPAWTSTDKKQEGVNGGIDIRPNSEIYIRATGMTKLGDSFDYPSFYVRPDKFMSQSYNSDWSNQVIDVFAGKMLSLSFSGTFNDGTQPGVFLPQGGTGISEIGKVGAGNVSPEGAEVYNAARRLVAYLIPHPANYGYDTSQDDEKSGVKNIPLLPDPNLWQCEYKDDLLTQSACSNKSYQKNGYPNANDDLINQVFPITSAVKSSVLGRYGGIIRWEGDGLEPDNMDPFQAKGISCDSGTCSNIASLNAMQGRIVGDLSAAAVIISSAPTSKVSFKNLITDNACNGTIRVGIVSGDDLIWESDISVSNSNWSVEHVSVTDGQKIQILQNEASYFDSSGAQRNCGRALAVKFSKYHDITIEQSGLVSFAVLGGASAGSCVVNARIINPKGSLKRVGELEADYYEYRGFMAEQEDNSANSDPFENLNVPVLSGIQQWDNGLTDNGSRKIFVRKGQVIRFSPEGWNSSWTSKAGARNCGIGMAMRIEPRPALLCRGFGSDYVQNPRCIKKYGDQGQLVGCDEVSLECSDNTNRAFCPNSSCFKAITGCVDGSDKTTPKYARTGCVMNNDFPSSCDFPSEIRSPSGEATPPPYDSNSCSACSDLRYESATRAAYIEQGLISICYDLENYYGKVANIPLSGFTEDQLGNNNIAKNAKKLGSFNGYYGNFENFKDSGLKDDGSENIIYKLINNTNIAYSGRLKFLLLDGSDFKNISAFYGDNTPSIGTSSYNGSNGFKIGISSYLDFINGAWLEAILCKESSDNSVDCRNASRPIRISGQSSLVELSNPVNGDLTPRTTTAFHFDDYGNVIRNSPRNPAIDCSNVIIGDSYYCHIDTTDAVSNIRLSFKIKDPEPANCYINNPGAIRNTSSPSTSAAYDGIIMPNPKFRQNDCNISDPNNPSPAVRNGISLSNNTCVANTGAGQFCNKNLPQDQENCEKEFLCVNKYSNNSGKYYVTVRVKTPGTNVSRIVGEVVAPVIEVMDGKPDGSQIGQAERIYKLIISDARYQLILKMCLIMMLTFYGFGYIMGVSDASVSDIISRTIKIGLIYLFVGPHGWDYFNMFAVKLFKNGTDYIAFMMASSFDDPVSNPALFDAINRGDYSDKTILFSSIDRVFGLIFSSTVQKKISALLFASIFGWFYLLLMYYALLNYIYAVATAILFYLTAQVFISVIFVLGPLFFVFTLFAQTKDMFDKWLSQLIGLSLQQIFLLTTLAFFNMMIYEVLKMALGYKVCWDEVWTINIVTRITLLSFWTIPSLPPNIDAQSDPGNIGSNDGIPSFFSILFIWVLGKIMLDFITFMSNVAADLGGSMKATELGAGLKGAVDGIKNNAKKQFNDKIYNKTVGEAKRTIDKELFYSGAKAKAEKKQNKLQRSKDRTNKGNMAKAGDQAKDKYLREKGAEYAKLSKEDQEKKLREVRDEAMIKKAKDLGLSEDQAKKLMNQKGLAANIGKLKENDSIIGAGFKVAGSFIFKGGTINKSLSEREIDTKFSNSQAKAALKNTDDIGRKDFVEAAKKGQIAVEKHIADKTVDAFVSTKDGIVKAAKIVADRKQSLIAQGVKAGAKGVAKGVAKGAKAAVKPIYDKEYDEAAQQLVDEGKINKMGKGTGWARSDIEKKAIRERLKQNQKDKKGTKLEMSSAKAVAGLEFASEALNDMDQGGSTDTVRSDNIATAIVGRKKIEAFSDRKKQIMANIKRERVGKFKEGLQEQVDNANKEIEAIKNDSGYKAADAIIQKIENDKSQGGYNDKSKAIVAKQAQLAAVRQGQAQGDVRQLEKELYTMQKDKQYVAQTNDLKKAYSQKNAADERVSKIESRRNEVAGKINVINKAEHLMESAKAIQNIPKYYAQNDEERDIIGNSSKKVQDAFEKVFDSELDNKTIDKLAEMNKAYQSYSPDSASTHDGKKNGPSFILQGMRDRGDI